MIQLESLESRYLLAAASGKSTVVEEQGFSLLEDVVKPLFSPHYYIINYGLASIINTVSYAHACYYYIIKHAETSEEYAVNLLGANDHFWGKAWIACTVVSAVLGNSIEFELQKTIATQWNDYLDLTDPNTAKPIPPDLIALVEFSISHSFQQPFLGALVAIVSTLCLKALPKPTPEEKKIMAEKKRWMELHGFKK